MRVQIAIDNLTSLGHGQLIVAKLVCLEQLTFSK